MKKSKKYKILKSLTIALCLAAIIVLITVFAICVYSSAGIDFDFDEALFSAASSPNVTKLYYNGSVPENLSNEYLPVEYQRISSADAEKDWFSINDISYNVKNAFIATEDREFYKHHGVNFKRTVAAMLGYITKTGNGFGASTITQQVIKNISGDNERTVKRKLDEIIRASHLEYNHSKDEIFELYLNIVPMGEGVAGIGMGAKAYFGKEPHELSVTEAATLVGITNAPSRYNPYTNYDACLKKRNVVLSAMLDCNYITEQEFLEYSAAPIFLSDRSYVKNEVYSWFTETVIEDLCRDLMSLRGYSYDAARLMVTRGGLSVYTTVDPTVQGILENYFENEVQFEDGRELSMVILDPYSAELKAVVGSRGKKNANRILNYSTVPITPGSTLKPIALYAPLIDSGRISWSTVLDDVPVEFYQSDGEYREFPRNSPQVYDGLITVADALAYSKNTIAVRLYGMLDKRNIIKSLKNDFGFDTLVSEGAVNDLAVSPLALGQLSKGVCLRKLTESYTVFSNDGRLCKGRSYIICLDSDGGVVIENEASEKEIFSPLTSKIMTQMMMRGVDFGTAASITLKEQLDVAGKTGTSGGSKDKLFIGFTPYYTAGIWCGYPNRDKAVNGATHLKIWDDVMKLIHEDAVRYDESPLCFSVKGLVRAPYCKDSGNLLSPECLLDLRGDRMDYGYFTPNDVPKEICRTHIGLMLDGAEISLIETPPRDFPKEIAVRDEPYSYVRRDGEEE